MESGKDPVSNEGIDLTFNNNQMTNSNASSKIHQADYSIKLLMLGDTGVGKSSLMVSFSDGEFASNLVGTMGIDHKVKTIKHN
jgi:GTPase SAR1 family protein